METYNRILIPTDGSEDADFAVIKGLSLAKLINAKEIIALYVKDNSFFKNYPADEYTIYLTAGQDKEAKEILENVRQKGEEMNLDVETLVVEGNPGEMILDVAEERNIDIIVIGTVGKTGVERFLLGSVAERVTRHAPCPVLVVRYTEVDEE